MTTISPSTIWMGDLEPYMDELFIITAFEQMGVTVKNVKLIHKHSSAATYCFVDLADQYVAQRTMLRLSNKVIPMTNPPVRFKLNHASYGREHLTVPEYSLFVGELSEDVDDLMLYDTFAKLYKSVRNAKVVLDKHGVSKGYGFVRFTDEEHRDDALQKLQHYIGLGSKSLRLSVATARSRYSFTYNTKYNSDPYSAYYQQQNYYAQSNWPGYSGSHYGYGHGQADASYNYGSYGQADMYNAYTATAEDDEELVDPNEEVDVEKQNQGFMERSEELYSALENSKWTPLDNINTKLTVDMIS